MTTIIETARLRLRTWRDGDADLFERLTNTRAVMAHLGGVQPPGYFALAVERMVALQAERGHCFWAVERKVDGALLGFCGIKISSSAGPDADAMPEIGWRLREDTWGQGYAREAAIASLDHGFGALGFGRVIAFTLPGNTASWGLMLRLGMTRLPDFIEPRFGPELNPTVYFEIRRETWLGGARDRAVQPASIADSSA
ncbi:GNAT family N-acetyltransferase [Sphingomonas sp. 1P06PA]|uniref:GNAT family N-acetyltransferase n=1 Tax=Sphingomonas sp. 1P06PA TaxID=554121 RepID=UPI0039A4A2B2